MAEWLIEEGIGEERAILLDNGTVIAARLEWPGGLRAGQIEDARLVSRISGAARGTARFASGEEALVDRLPRQTSEGATLRLKVTRAAMAEAGRHKLAHARPTTHAPRPAPSLAETLRQEGAALRVVPRFPAGAWEEVMADAFAREIAFPTGALLLTPSPAMTLIDVDGAADAKALALAAVRPIAAALRRMDLGGSIGIDFPTLSAKADRRAVDEALDAALDDWPHERTAMNGFGFVQIVARLARVPILQRIALSPAGAAARLLLRQAEGLSGAGAILMSANPAVKARITSEWEAELARRTGREIRWGTDAGLAIAGGHAQLVTR